MRIFKRIRDRAKGPLPGQSGKGETQAALPGSGARLCEWRAAPPIFRTLRCHLLTARRKAPPEMIVGVGIDIVQVGRVQAVLDRRGGRALARLYTPDEAARCRASKHPPESFAARFAAKEAFFKAMGTGWGRGGEWTEVEVCSAEGGAPSIRLTGRAAGLAAARGVRRVHLSMTHAGDTAAAVVVLEG